jgi:hypothetical protein
MVLQTLTDRAVANFADKQDSAQFDPAIIFVIAEMVVQIIEMLEDCREPDDATEIANDPSWLQKRLVRVQARRMMGRKEYRKNGSEVVDSLLDAGKSITASEMAGAYGELL